MWRKIAKLMPWLLITGLIAGWCIFLRPFSLGGPARYIVVAGKSMVPTLQTGDLAVTRAQPEYGIGDIVTFTVKNSIVIHRIVGGSAKDGFVTHGDGNGTRNDSWRVYMEDINGRLWLRIPGAGNYIVNLASYIKKPAIRAVLAASIVILFLGDIFNRARRSRLEILNQRRKRFHEAGGG